MEGEADVPDLARRLLLGDPLPDAQALQLVPGGHVGDHVHQVVVDVVGAQAAQLLAEGALHTRAGLDQVLGQLRGDVHPVAGIVLLQNPAHGDLVAGIDVGRVQVIHAAVDGGHQLASGLVQIDATALLGKAHAAVAQHGQLILARTRAVLHAGVLVDFHGCASLMVQGEVRAGAFKAVHPV